MIEVNRINPSTENEVKKMQNEQVVENAAKLTMAQQREQMKKVFNSLDHYNTDEPSFMDLCQRVYKPHNALFITLSFTRGTMTNDMVNLWEIFTSYAANLAGIKPQQMAAQAFAFCIPSPHLHGVIYSTKDRRSGKSISQLNQAQREELEKFWMCGAGLESKQPDSLNIQSIWSPEGVARYIAGDRNLTRQLQHCAQLPTINPDLLRRKLIKKHN